LIEQLLARPHRFQLFQAVQLLVQWLDEQGISRERALREHVRFENSLSLAFPQAEIEALKSEACSDPSAEPEEASPPGCFRITPTFIGLLGSSGALPYHYTERVHQARNASEPGASKAFFDLFTHCFVALAYESWRKYQLELHRDESPQPLSGLLLALAGHTPTDDTDGRRRGLNHTIAFYAGVLQQRPVSAAVMAAVLSGYLKIPVTVEEGVGYWDRMAETEQICIGRANATLGEDTILGSSSWRPDLRARLRLGPLDNEEYRQFVPDAQGRKKLREVLSVLGNPVVAYDVQVAIRAGSIRPLCLNSRERLPQLGCDAFLISEPAQHDRADMHFEIRLVDALPAHPVA
jgi:type VI secretion system protein ImpH